MAVRGFTGSFLVSSTLTTRRYRHGGDDVDGIISIRREVTVNRSSSSMTRGLPLRLILLPSATIRRDG